MAVHDNSYSRFIAWAKILLPLGALAILSTIFLFSRTIDTSRSLTFANLDVQQLIREQRVKAPRYASITDDGAAISFVAETAQPDPKIPGLIRANDVQMSWQSPNSDRLDLNANTGTLNTELGQIQFHAGVDILTSTGYLVVADELLVSLNTTDVSSDQPVEAAGPLGTIEAGAMHLQRIGADYVLVFKDGVKLIYDPRETKGDE